MKTTKKLLFLCLPVVLATTGINSSNVILNAEESNISVTNVKEAINKLINSHNYTIEVSTKAGPININYEIMYTENSFFDNFLGDEYGYVEVEDKVFYFDLYQQGIEREFTASNALVDENGNLLDSVWNNDLFYGFHKLKSTEFDNATGKTFTASTKRVKNLFINLFQLDYSVYQYTNDVVFSVDNDVNTLEFVFSLSTGEIYNGKISNFGTTKIDVVDTYLAAGGNVHTNDDTLNQIIDLFADYNYTRLMYDDRVDDYSVVAGREMYDDFFFYTFLDDYYILNGLGYEIGMVGLDKTYSGYYSDGTLYDEFVFEGSFYCFVIENEDGTQSIQVMTSMPINTDPFVPNVYNYPTFLKMFKDTQYLKLSGGSKTEYYTSKMDLVNDFVSNFQMSETLASVGAVATGVYIEFLENGSEYYAGTLNKETVVFKLEVNYYGAIETIDFVYTDFNTTAVDCITEETVDAYIQGVIDNAIKKIEEEQKANESDGE